MPNWNSKEKKHTPVKKEETKAKQRQAISLFGEGCSVRHISKVMGLSISRINEYIRKEYNTNNSAFNPKDEYKGRC